MISTETYETIMANADALNSAIIYDRDFSYVSLLSHRVYLYYNLPITHQNYFGYKTLERSYLLRINGKVAERPQHLLMRVAVGIHGKNIDKAIESYHLVGQSHNHHDPLLMHVHRCPSDTSLMLHRHFSPLVRLTRRCRRASWLQ